LFRCARIYSMPRSSFLSYRRGTPSLFWPRKRAEVVRTA
jgi:hypothetical protein